MVDFEHDLDAALGERIRACEVFSARVWGSLANGVWTHTSGEVEEFGYRPAGRLVAWIRGEGDYLDWYCSWDTVGQCDPEVAAEMVKRGWTHSTWAL